MSLNPFQSSFAAMATKGSIAEAVIGRHDGDNCSRMLLVIYIGVYRFLAAWNVF